MKKKKRDAKRREWEMGKCKAESKERRKTSKKNLTEKRKTKNARRAKGREQEK